MPICRSKSSPCSTTTSKLDAFHLSRNDFSEISGWLPTNWRSRRSRVLHLCSTFERTTSNDDGWALHQSCVAISRDLRSLGKANQTRIAIGQSHVYQIRQKISGIALLARSRSPIDCLAPFLSLYLNIHVHLIELLRVGGLDYAQITEETRSELIESRRWRLCLRWKVRASCQLSRFFLRRRTCDASGFHRLVSIALVLRRFDSFPVFLFCLDENSTRQSPWLTHWLNGSFSS